MKRVQIKEELCMGCGLCRVACQTEHSVSHDVIKAVKKENQKPRIRVERKGEISFSVPCRHCDEPWCAYSCISGAMTRDPITGIVSSDPERCIGCWTCIVACPNSALIKDKANHVILKCDLCGGKEIPACVANCPNEALELIDG
ncbi:MULTISPECIES: 4Fe-4S dicluster domain-containing protein [Dehalococcoides]|mgnify:CR=1 FL=1|jgi:carbon-monoxide dehydrogenase iron sulfur subunit|uniref:4Fe-4S ferredoxin n=2 Tax=Dehalococcoides mccartyi TaxID=61435 RepID=A0A142VAI7_9CHLR|nr:MULTISPECIES: 4Fe-4S dicluster domain-containing protein [Dehalococcoides]AGG06619.1 putative oxidoreductase, electron transferring subunit [Dehalococcoides mccartyi DCMB5]AGG08111.1 putative oxidoreductase, electron transferring subunit [Dehalococcoides mccartyi BTF08]AII61123.1 4Fe-4S ferredoxin [Dehalococcoides mccartyi CG5]AMU86808.1 iron-sulfur cluster-binding protein [Dehalococcoides mccartyi]AQU06153.1 4Fe-4S ferredoxin [Dehalococcoides mccartyi]